VDFNESSLQGSGDGLVGIYRGGLEHPRIRQIAGYRSDTPAPGLTPDWDEIETRNRFHDHLRFGRRPATLERGGAGWPAGGS
jgi:hypothetical protein